MGRSSDGEFGGEPGHSDDELADKWRCLVAKQRQGSRLRQPSGVMPGSEVGAFNTVGPMEPHASRTCDF